MSDADIIGSPIDRSKRPRREEEDWDSDYEDAQDDRHPKRQAVPDPETKAPHFIGATIDGSDEDNRNARYKRGDGTAGLQDSDVEDELQIVLDDESQPSKAASATVTVAAPAELVDDNANKIAIRSLVSTKDAGIIIGRGGKNVGDIRERSTAKVTISDIVQGAVERILTVTGRPDAIAKAYALVGQKILSETPLNEAGDSEPEKVTIRLIIPDSRMGTLIGRGGSMIRAIKEQSGVNAKASEEALPISTERLIYLTGSPEGIQVAVKKISEVLLEHNDTRLPPHHVPYAPQSQAMPTRGFHPMGRAAASAMGYGMMGMGAMPMNGAAAQFYYPQQGAAGYGGMPVNPRQAGYGMGGMSGVVGSHAQQIFIPNEMVGCIIGKRGSKINEIRQMSGSHIKIADPQGDNNERLVTITGTPESNQMALYMLYARLESEKSRVNMR
ncbi:uncharacterized protein BYT42DRAFT_325860 [Radiomyces spectabilis]|uniref:uncharacterized protein n=1 Tax=Radiomyces spectabilis TaxID=64574 RepID=UPI00221F6854|nr:uncharacterized protein BYT42DRAFT_325860 [Radiomyces spectabilis]KAI8379408.1 hypothetical protein BYT42DRAFT_325860 [Radiomyces spectabilis]